MALGIILLVGLIIGVPIVAIAAFSKSRINENELADLRSILKGLTRNVEGLHSELERLRAQLGVPPAAMEPTNEKPSPVEPISSEMPEAPSVEAALAETAEQTARDAPPADERIGEPDMRSVLPPAPRSSAADSESLEEALTSRWLVWLGAVSIALAGTFLVKYAIDQGLLSPAIRCTLGFLLGAGLTVFGEWLRQRPLQRAIASVRPNHVPAALTASGLFTAFASIYAAYALYGLLPPLVAFAGLAAVALIAVGLSLLQGMFVALLGVFGGFLTPALIATPNPSAWGLVLYLAVIEAACLAVARYQAWWSFALATLAGAMLWPLLWMSNQGPWSAGDELPLGLFLLITAIAFYAIQPSLERAESNEDWFQQIENLDAPAKLALIAGVAVTVILFIMAGVADYSVASLVLFGAAALLSLVAGRRAASFDGLAVVSAVATVALIGILPVPKSVILPLPLPGAPFMPPELSFFATTSVVFATLFGLGGFAGLWGAKRPAIWAGVSAAVPVLLLVTAYGRIADFNVDLAWAALALGLAALNLFAAERVERYRAAKGLEISLGIYAAAVVACLSLSAAMSLREAWLTVALSIQLPVLGWISRRIPGRSIPIIAAVVAVIVLVRLALNYNIFQYPLAARPAFSWVVYGYGIPAIAFFTAARLFRKADAEPLVALLKAGGLAFSVLLVSLQIRLLIAGSLDAQSYGLLEQSLQSIAWLAIGTGLAAHHRRAEDRISFHASRILLTAATAQVLLLQLLLSNPILSREFVGEYPLINVLFLAYAIPAMFAFGFAFLRRKDADRQLAAFASIAGFLLVFAYVSLEVRRAFHGSILYAGAQSNAELYTYSLVWLGYALALLGLGIVWRQTMLRYASLTVLVIAVLKVFVFDMAGLTGLYRVASFLGLGLSLVGIGYIYQRFVFRHPGAATGASLSGEVSFPSR